MTECRSRIDERRREARGKRREARGEKATKGTEGTKGVHQASDMCRGDASVLAQRGKRQDRSTALPCLNRGLNGLRRFRGLPLTTLPPLHRSHPLCPSHPRPIRRRDRPPCSVKDTRGKRQDVRGRRPPSPITLRNRPLCLRGRGNEDRFCED